MKKTILLFGIIILFAGCIDWFEDDCEPRLMDFKIPITIYPVQDTIAIGDTIWAEISFRELVDENTGETIVIDFENNTHIKHLVVFVRLDTIHANGDYYYSSNSFEIIPLNGDLTILQGSAFPYNYLEFTKEDGFYKGHYAFVAKERGLFEMSFFVSVLQVFGPDVYENYIVDSLCPTSNSAFWYYKVNDEINHNFHLYYYGLDEYIHNLDSATTELYGTFPFFVN